MNYQGVRDGQHRRAMPNDQRLGFREAERQIGVDGGLRLADQPRQRAGLPRVGMRDLGAVLSHEESLPPILQWRRRIISAASPCVAPMSAGQCPCEVRANHEAALADVPLSRLA